MTPKNKPDKMKLEKLRQKAKEKLNKENIQKIQIENMSIEDLRYYIEELRVHQIELEMQNRQLLETQEKLTECGRKYSDLYDFAPVGYLTLAPDGKIMEANLTASKMLNTSRKTLIGTPVYRYFDHEDRDIVFLHLRKLFRDYGRHTCEVRKVGKKPEIWLRLNSVCDENKHKNRFCRTTLTDITDRKEMEIALFRSESQLKLLSQHMIENQEKERKRIAYDLHDGVAQLLAASKLFTQNLLNRLSEYPEEYQILAKLLDIHQKALTDIKRIVSDLRPAVLDGMGIIAAIEWLCKQYQDIDPNLTITRKFEVDEKEVSENLKSVIFRILQELMSNIVKHSQANQVLILLEKSDGTLRLVVKDNGKGFDPENHLFKRNFQDGIGLISVTERARTSGGKFELSSSINRGTTVTIKWPVED